MQDYQASRLRIEINALKVDIMTVLGRNTPSILRHGRAPFRLPLVRFADHKGYENPWVTQSHF